MQHMALQVVSVMNPPNSKSMKLNPSESPPERVGTEQTHMKHLVDAAVKVNTGSKNSGFIQDFLDFVSLPSWTTFRKLFLI